MTTHPTTPDQGDERRAMLMALAQLRWLAFGEYRTEGWEGAPPTAAETEKALTAALAQPVAQEAIPPIERDESMGRTYIPMPGGWEVQTQGKGSTFRICNTKTGDRWPVLCKDIHAALEQMARDAHAAFDAAPPQPVSAEAGKGAVPFGWFAWGASGKSIRFWTTDRARAESYTRETGVACNPLYTRPSESVAVSGEVSEFEAWWEVFFRLAGKDKAWPVKQAAREAFAVLALAGSGGKA